MQDADILLKIKRYHSKDEAVNAVNLELKQARYENGVLKSDISELNDEIAKLKQLILDKESQLTQLKRNMKESAMNKAIEHLRTQNKQIQEKNKKQTDIIIELRQKLTWHGYYATNE